MKSPERYYEEHLRGRSKEEIMRCIRSLKREIIRLKREAESNEPKCMLKIAIRGSILIIADAYGKKP